MRMPSLQIVAFVLAKKVKWVGYIADGNKKWVFTFTDHSCKQGTT